MTDGLSPDEATERAKAAVRRLQAALAPSLFSGDRPGDDLIVTELGNMLRSQGVRRLLGAAPASQFTEVIRRTQQVVEGGSADADIINAEPALRRPRRLAQPALSR